MVKFMRRATGHFVMFIETGMHLITCIPGHIYCGHESMIFIQQDNERIYGTMLYTLACITAWQPRRNNYWKDFRVTVSLFLHPLPGELLIKRDVSNMMM